MIPRKFSKDKLRPLNILAHTIPPSVVGWGGTRPESSELRPEGGLTFDAASNPMLDPTPSYTQGMCCPPIFPISEAMPIKYRDLDFLLSGLRCYRCS